MLSIENVEIFEDSCSTVYGNFVNSRIIRMVELGRGEKKFIV